MPTVTRISIAPVKGLALVHPHQVMLEQAGVRENRRFHIVDADGRRYNQLRNGALVQIEQKYDDAAQRLELRFPDGSTAPMDDEAHGDSSSALSLADHFLIAMPSMADSRFSDTVIYVLEHTPAR